LYGQSVGGRKETDDSMSGGNEEQDTSNLAILEEAEIESQTIA
jgi:hypothetical protein